MPRAKSAKPVKPDEQQWFTSILHQTWPTLPITPPECAPCARSYTPQIRSGPYEGRSVIRMAWATAHNKALRAGEHLTQTCDTPNCGNTAHWVRMGDEAQRLRDAWFTGSFKNVKDVVAHLGSPFCRVTANQILTRRRHASLPDSREESKLRQQGILPNKESALEVQTDGRIHGPDGALYPHIRAAELATGLDRRTIAQHLNRPSPTGGWSYHAGHLPYVPYGDSIGMTKGLPYDARQGLNIRKGCPDAPLDNNAP